MARTKGQRSYAPEEIDFSYNVNNSPEKYPLGRPWSLMKRLAAKNIVLEAYIIGKFQYTTKKSNSQQQNPKQENAWNYRITNT